MGDARAEQIGVAEALFREVNERIEGLSRGTAGVSDGMMHVVCECGDSECAQTVAVAIDEYERIRGDAKQFIMIPGHETRSAEIVVEGGDAYLVVRKRDGAERIAEATDPRR